MQCRLTAAQRNNGCPQACQVIDPAQHLIGGDRIGYIVVLVAVGAIEIAPPDRHYLCEDRVPAGLHCTDEHPCFPGFPVYALDPAAELHTAISSFAYP